MPPRRERRWPRIAAGYVLFLLVLSGATAFLYESVAPTGGQPLVLRLAVAVLLAVILLHIRSNFRGDPLWDPPSEFENALVPERVGPKFDPSLVKLRGELADSVKSRSYFDKVLWPRLLATTAANNPGGTMTYASMGHIHMDTGPYHFVSLGAGARGASRHYAHVNKLTSVRLARHGRGYGLTGAN